MNEIIVMATQVSGKTKTLVIERVKAGKCLCCDNPSLKRGLCHQCYYKWRTFRASIGSAAKRGGYDARLIRSGKLLEPQAVRAMKTNSVFSKVASEME
jgi:hypothetical protein